MKARLRRAFLAGSCQTLLGYCFFGIVSSCIAPAARPASEPGNESTPLTREEWMKQWMEAKKVDGPLIISRFADPMYFLMEPISWIPNPDQNAQYKRVDAPKGFVSDLASIPRVFWSLLRPDGEYAYAAIIHDYLYWTQTTTREVADHILKFAMQDFAVGSGTVATIFDAVRIGGQSAWEDNAKLRKNGEKRILSQFPKDPTVRWETWKQRKDVFVS
jgi:hypothetical protein